MNQRREADSKRDEEGHVRILILLKAPGLEPVERHSVVEVTPVRRALTGNAGFRLAATL